jgi:hypothetical protein
MSLTIFAVAPPVNGAMTKSEIEVASNSSIAPGKVARVPVAILAARAISTGSDGIWKMADIPSSREKLRK